MKTIIIHKNELKRYFLVNWTEKCKIGKEKMRRWIDVPEYIEIGHQKCKKHILRDWCVNCGTWQSRECLDGWDCQEEIKRCIKCGEFYENKN